MHSDPPDIVEVEVFRKALENLTNEMAITLKRASGSTIVVDTHDFSTAIFDAAGEQLAFSGWVTMHCAASYLGVRDTVALYADDPELRRGDAIIVNDPYTSGALHQADVGLVTPMFAGDDLIGWSFSNVHVLDIGGSAIGGLATTAHDVWSEALRLPPVKIAKEGVLDPAWERTIAAAVRLPDAVINDLRGMIAANHTAQRKVDELVERYGVGRYRQLSEISKDLTEDALKDKIAKLPDGEYVAEEWIEYDGHGVEELLRLQCTMTIAGDRMKIALTGDPQIDAPVCGAPPGVIGSVMSAMLCMLTFDIPMNQGVWRHIEFDLGPRGTVVNAEPPAPVSLSHVGSGFRAGKAFNDVLAQACALSEFPELRSRAAAAPQNAVPSALFFGENQFGRPTVSVLLATAIGVGGGAQSIMDGQDCYGAQSMQGTRMPDVEVLEGQEPMLVLYRKLIANSGGPGAFRGGMGLQEATVLWSTDAMRGVVQSHCERVPPRGISGGMPGGGGRITMIRGSDARAKLEAGEFRGVEGLESEALPSISDTTIGRDDVIVMSGGGGGGVGDPLRRDPQAVAMDLREDRITAAAAAEVYGVAVDAAGGLLIERTEALRGRLRRERLCAANAPPPSREVTERGDPAVALVETDTGWLCAACGQPLSGREGDWREAAVTWTTSAAAALRGRGQMVRECAETEPVFERTSACGGCGSLLLVEIGREAASVDVAAAEVAESVRG
jgi:N-methylhydantoinase B